MANVKMKVYHSFEYYPDGSATNRELMYPKKKFKTENDITAWAEKYKMRNREPIYSAVDESVDEMETEILPTSEFIFVYARAIQFLFRTKENNQPFHLLDTQRVTLMTLLTSAKGVLAQVSTGEGKSLIVAGVAIYRALAGQKVDIITSNKMLAVRDSTLSTDNGGLRNLYEVFGISVANNCSQMADDRIRAYDSAVVYGELSNFQRDYLLHEFYERNIRGDRTFDCVIIDEVDCMLLDRGNNMLYLSHDIPGMEMLESLYVFIWENICSCHLLKTCTDTLHRIKSAIFYDLYGSITKDYLIAWLHQPLKENPTILNRIWTHLLESRLIDQLGRLQMEKMEDVEDNLRQLCDNIVDTGVDNLHIKLVYFFRQIVERQRRIRIPKYLLPFVDRHLDSWLDNAWRALHQLKLDKDYVVSQDRTGVSLDINPQVIIIDPDTGTDQVSSQWDKALHQFLQLKEGCQITMQSLKAVFISNVNYIKQYEKLFGVSGTLGSKIEREFLKRTYECDYCTIPTASPRHFQSKPAKVFKSIEGWLNAIVNEIQQTVFSVAENGRKPRSILVFCGSINEVKLVYQHVKKVMGTELANDKVSCYTRDYQKFAFESSQLGIGHVIVATNLAGRGTDIKLTQQLRENGGLHICLTYLPENDRIEEQAMGRASRQGDRGSGTLILCQPPGSDADRFASVVVGSPSDDEWNRGKIFEMKVERNRQESQRLSRLTRDFFGNIRKQENCFNEFKRHYAKMRQQLADRQCDEHLMNAICDSALDQWALWLDSVHEGNLNFESMSEVKLLAKLKNELIDKQRLPDKESEFITWMTPARSIGLAKHLMTQKTFRRFLFIGCCSNDEPQNQAIRLLSRIVDDSKENFFYPAAHYYRVFAFMKDNKQFPQDNKTKFILATRATHNLLRKHVEMQTSFSYKISQLLCLSSKKNKDFPYKQQKENNIKLLENYMGSLCPLLGTLPCSAQDLQRETAIDPRRAKLYFNELVQSGTIGCQVNPAETVPERDVAIQEMADEHNIDACSLIAFLDKKRQQILKEEDMEKDLRETNLIPCTRERFWRKLIEAKVLQQLPEVIRSTSKADYSDSGTDCVIISISELDNAPLNKLERNATIDLVPLDSNLRPILYRPAYRDMRHLEEQKKIVFWKSYVQQKLSNDEYRSAEPKTFEFNKIAFLNLDKLKNLNLVKLFDNKLKIEDFGKNRTKIHEKEWGKIWEALIDQKVIDEDGYLFSNNKFQEFIYPECPMYVNPVSTLIKKTFLAEMVTQSWLNAKDDIQGGNAIANLPYKPYLDMLASLHDAHVISSTRVNDVKDADRLRNAVMKATENIKKKTESNAEESKETDSEITRILSFLKSRQAVYAINDRSLKMSLIPIERSIREIRDKTNISTELYVFGLEAFDQVIDVKEQKWQSAMICRAAAISTIGVTQLALAVMVIWSWRDSKGLVAEGLNDFSFVTEKLRSGDDFSWSDWWQFKMKSVKQNFKLESHICENLGSSYPA